MRSIECALREASSARGVGHSLILGRGSARLEDIATGRTHAVSARCVLGHIDFQIDPSSRESGGPGDHAARDREAALSRTLRSSVRLRPIKTV